jgi:hypothetical protein
MDVKHFRETLGQVAPPNLPLPLLALWYDAKGDWSAAHEAAQADNGISGAWVHAYLHRKEGDISNAGYWYRRASKPVPTNNLDQEWEEIATSLLAEEP